VLHRIADLLLLRRQRIERISCRDFRRDLLNSPARFTVHHVGQWTRSDTSRELRRIVSLNEAGTGKAHAEPDAIALSIQMALSRASIAPLATVVCAVVHSRVTGGTN